jgi:soluble lytic murein transglycosylase-like protein
MKRFAFAVAAAGAVLASTNAFASDQSSLQAMAAAHAAANGVPLSLAHRVIMRESRYNARAVSKGNYGIMQIRLGTARGLGYTGSAAGLLDPNTNMTYAMKYLAGAYRVAGGNESRAVSLYASGYYYAAKRQGMTTRVARTREVTPTFTLASVAPTYAVSEDAVPVRASRHTRQRQVAQTTFNPFAALFAPAATQRVRYAYHHRHGHHTRVARNYR